jgi:dipeptidyl-peptidase-4
MNKNFLSFLMLLCFSFLNSYGQTISLEDIWVTGKYRAEYFPSFNWTSDGQHYTDMTARDEKGTPLIKLYHIKNGPVKELTALMPTVLPENTVFEDYSLSPDESKILFTVEEEPIYRRSSKAYYYIFDTKTGSLLALHDFAKGKISYPSFSPDGKRLAFVRENNLYVTEIKTLKESPLTMDGKFNFVINGACDWVYEEEFEFAKAFFWSPDSKKIAYYRFDESKVKEYNMQRWGDIYPTDYRYKYPKVGEENSQVKIMCAFIEENKTVEIDASFPGEREYFPRLRWTGNAQVLSYYRMNRLQNKLEIIHYDVAKKMATTPYKESDKAYVEINDYHFYFSATEDFVFTSEKTGYRHIYLYNKATNSILPLTQGAFEITEITGVDEKHQLVYFISQEDSPLEKHLYSVDFSGKKKKKLTKESGTHDISFSPSFDYYTDIYSNANTPAVITLQETVTGLSIRTLGDNANLKSKLAENQISKISFFKFTTSQNTELNAWMIKPANFDPAKKYPVLLTIYGGPGSQEVTDSWRGTNYLWYQLLAQKGYMIVSVDGRGTGGRGAAFKKLTQLNLGKYETEDLIETAKHLQTQKYVDASRIGIFGWSFGGYLSSLAITKGADYFKSAIAVAPVTNWRYYDNIYTERYMGLPADNAKGYDENAPAYFAQSLKGNYLLIHGTADDNVHLQNAIEMQRALIKANKQFDMFYYPDRNHSIYGGITRYHLYKMMTDFILKKL